MQTPRATLRPKHTPSPTITINPRRYSRITLEDATPVQIWDIFVELDRFDLRHHSKRASALLREFQTKFPGTVFHVRRTDENENGRDITVAGEKNLELLEGEAHERVISVEDHAPDDELIELDTWNFSDINKQHSVRPAPVTHFSSQQLTSISSNV